MEFLFSLVLIIGNIWLPASFKMFALICMHGCLYFITGCGERKFRMESTGFHGLILNPLLRKRGPGTGGAPKMFGTPGIDRLI